MEGKLKLSRLKKLVIEFKDGETTRTAAVLNKARLFDDHCTIRYGSETKSIRLNASVRFMLMNGNAIIT